ncbi:MAG: hypothetical protein LBU55_02680 [Elusimicrobiota bacterium]|jgi:hypothetical protein|nr:hypothetical protein [Elusimicrobiota bacterium]
MLQASENNFVFLIFVASFIISLFARFLPTVEIYIALFVMLSAVFVFFFAQFRLKLSYSFLPVILFVLAALVIYHFSDYKYNVRNELYILLSSAILYLLNSLLKDNERKNILFVLVFIAILLSIYIFSAVALSFILTNRFEVFLTKELHAMICFLLCVLPLSFIFWKPGNKLYFYVSIALFLAIMLTKSILATTIASAQFCMFLFSVRNELKIKPATIVSPFCLSFATNSIFLIKSRFFSLTFNTWLKLLPAAKENLLFGVGFGNCNSASSFFCGAEYTSNMFLKILIETGILGTAAFIFVIIAFLANVLKKLECEQNKKVYFCILISLLSFLVYNFFNSSAFVSTNFLLLFFLLSYPTNVCVVEKRKTKVNFYCILAIFLPFSLAVSYPVYSSQNYKKAITFINAQKYLSAEKEILKALKGDCLNPKYMSKLSDIYFIRYQTIANSNEYYLDLAIEAANEALFLNKYKPYHYYQLSYLYKIKGNEQLSLKYINKALKIDANNPLYKSFYNDFGKPSISIPASSTTENIKIAYS